MLTANECRKLLGEEAKTLTDQQINEIQDWLIRMADIAIAAEETRI
jgi:hypothetical protein